MVKHPFPNCLGELLRLERTTSRLTQAAVAHKAGLSVPTVRKLERGHGNLQSWHRALDAIGLELAGRNLPPGPTFGKQIAALRKRKRLSIDQEITVV